MKRPVQSYINNLRKDEIDLLFGEGSQVVVNFIKYSTNNKCFTIDCKLLTTNPELCVESYPVGLDHLVLESWKYMGIKKNINITHSIDVI
jgi:hypothetical protein